MGKSKKDGTVELVNYGRYTPFEAGSRQLPRIREYTHTIPCRDGMCFGFIVRAHKAKGDILRFVVERPGDDGDWRTVDERELRPRKNTEKFYVGEFVAEPVERALGRWRLSLYYKDRTIVQKEFDVISDAEVGEA